MILNIGIRLKFSRISLATCLLVVIPVAHPACEFDAESLFSLTDIARWSACLGWQPDTSDSGCRGTYRELSPPSAPDDTLHISADSVTLQANGRSNLTGNVEAYANQRVVSAPTAYVTRDSATHDVTRVELLGGVHYLEPEREIWANNVQLNPVDNSAEITNALYRLKTARAHSVLPAWGIAHLIKRLSNRDLQLHQVT